MSNKSFQPGDRVSWSAPVFAAVGTDDPLMWHPTLREYGVIDFVTVSLDGSPSYQVQLESDPNGYMLWPESALRKEPQ